MSTARATQPVSRSSEPARRTQPAKRQPSLRVVDARRSRPTRNVAGLAGTVLAVALFGSVFSVVTSQVLLVQAQSRLDELDSRIEAQVAADKRLNHDIAALESPGRIVTEARDRLGMVEPSNVGYLQSQGDDDQRVTVAADGTDQAVDQR